ncbi:hypothetical protein CHLRE_13g586450v5 [Chlamydomonas reinhardtii]|uniref:N-acetyltransferase domain-containing protein n=1 Tax=Chlamydomonas reinhardtii TaxID=3055 RepID=A8HUK8_CHLRE|nr:uncharacterized protein CHLRE_13g586450v5 [Chlamydomonas reinhardtii]XP_042917647.1 uncharacterized protein CHLRE_13g586450v5 [Chlamydomonas reinhardtii]PNW74126.1 hypothetical protein CHLRE_13g586450v5 [Chlamydomonas reinhardtii]PNW74127.1 hypothetical protein CHLRE_13g586450v5 [Chlamydomonas reinhardtii]|eukprot:XP_001693617.1 predicted protein [Chlamydomonas reinhardtii]
MRTAILAPSHGPASSFQQRTNSVHTRTVLAHGAAGSANRSSAPSASTTPSASSALDATQPIIRTLKECDTGAITRASVCFGRSMRTDPTMTYVTGGRCPERVGALFEQVATMCMRGARDPATTWLLETPRSGGDSDSADVVCIACEYPAAYPSDWELLRAGLLRVLLACPGWGVLRALMNMLDQFNATKAQFNKEHGDFLYIACFGTAPEQQGRGLGSQLMRRVLQHADAKDLPVYLEASGAASAAFYRRHGFQDIKQVRASPGAPDLIIMARPRASQLQQHGQQQ